MPAPGPETVFGDSLQIVQKELHLSLDAGTQAKLLEHYRLLVRWNRRMNLTTLRDPEEIATRHFGESLFLARELPAGIGSILDVGSGAGFPGLPLAAWRSEMRVTLLEAVQRKTVFLREVSRSWENVSVRNERLEGLAGSWDASVMRAVAIASAVPHLARVSTRTAILTGEEGVEEACKTGFYAWRAPKPVPWGKRRFLLLGEITA